jgi:hypothetical protein
MLGGDGLLQAGGLAVQLNERVRDARPVLALS